MWIFNLGKPFRSVAQSSVFLGGEAGQFFGYARLDVELDEAGLG